MMPQAQPRGLLKNFRRKSSANALDLAQSPQETPAQSSFRVLERPDKVDALKRASAVLPQHHNTKSADNLNSHNHLAQSHSSAYYDTSGSSARHSSSSSTLPSSIDHDQDDNGDLFALRKQKPLPPISPIAFQDIPTPPTPSFSARAGRALSFGLGKSKTPTTPTAAIPYSASTPGAAPSSEPMPMRASMSRPLPARPVLEGLGSEGLNRNRAAGHTGYAASNKPPVLGSSFGASDFGGGLENIFDGLQAKEEVRNSPSKNIIRKIQSAYFDRSTSPVDTVQEDSDSLFPARTSSQQGNTPSPAAIDDRRYSWGSKKSSEELISGDSSAYHSPSSELFPVSAKATGAAALTSLAGMQGYETVPNEQMSPDLRGPAGPFKLDTTSADNHHGPSSPSPNPTAITSPQRDSVFVIGSNENTPRPRKSVLHTDAAFLYESPTGPENKIISPVKQRATPTRPGPKKMTSAQFAQAQRTGGLVRQKEEEEKSEVSENDEPEDEDDIEKQKKVTAQRRRQEATMSVYRQQMKKVAGGTGDTLSGLPAPGARDRSSMASLSIPNFSFANSSTAPTNEPLVEEEDEDIPLAILQAHGFPSKNRPPNMSSAQSVYAASAAGDHPGPLPAFARKLPQDPYFGSSLINPTNRQSLAFGNAAPSVHGGVTSGPPGGLVGVIATEEKARAGRRGSANQVAGNFSTPLSTPLPPNMQGQPQMPAFNRSMSMTSLAGPQMAMGMGMPMGMDPNMPMSPEQAAFNTQQQMAQLMQMQAQMMHQMMALQAQAGQMGLQMPMPPQGMQSMPSMTGSFMQSPQAANTRPPSIMGGRPPSIAQGRSMSMLSPPSNWGGDMSQQRTSMMLGAQPRPGYAGSVFGMNSSGPAAGYTPSIAPSERSNVGMPSRYRPVSTVDSVTDQHLTKSRSHTMTSLSYNPHTAPDSKQARAPSPLGADQVAASENATKPKTTIRIIDKLRGAPKSSLFGKSGDNKSSGKSEDDEDEAGWAKMARKREAMRQKRASKAQGKNNDQEHLAELYHGLDD